jgi:hypothetical protein
MIRDHIRQAFLHPLQNRTRAFMFGGQFLGSLGVSFLQVFVALDMLRFGISGMMAYFMIRFALAGFVLFPFFTWLYFNRPRHWFMAAILGTECIALLPLFAPDILQHPMPVGVCLALASTGYWQAFHLAMTAQTSDRGRGYEVSLSQIFQTVGGIAGSLAGGAASAWHFGPGTALVGFVVQIAATIMFFRSIPRPKSSDAQVAHGQVQATRLRDEIFGNPQRSFLTLLDGVYAVMADVLLPAWLKLIGIAALGVGVVNALRTAMQIVAAPLTGKFFAADKQAELRLGSTLGLIGWLPWCFAPQSWLLLASIPLWSCGNILYRTGIEGRWYSNRSATAILAKEILLTIARLLSAMLIIPAMFGYPAGFAWLAVVTAVMMISGSYWSGQSHPSQRT